MHRVHNLFPDDCRHPFASYCNLGATTLRTAFLRRVHLAGNNVFPSSWLSRCFATGWQGGEGGGRGRGGRDDLLFWRFTLLQIRRYDDGTWYQIYAVEFSKWKVHLRPSFLPPSLATNAPIDFVSNHRDLSLLFQRSLCSTLTILSS